MKKIAFTILCCGLLMLFAAPVWADLWHHARYCRGGDDASGRATGCGVVITVNPDGTASVTSPVNGNPYDGADDTLVGIQNNSGGSFNSITLTGSSPIFGFDGDGVCGYSTDGHNLLLRTQLASL